MLKRLKRVSSKIILAGRSWLVTRDKDAEHQRDSVVTPRLIMTDEEAPQLEPFPSFRTSSFDSWYAIPDSTNMSASQPDSSDPSISSTLIWPSAGDVQFSKSGKLLAGRYLLDADTADLLRAPGQQDGLMHFPKEIADDDDPLNAGDDDDGGGDFSVNEGDGAHRCPSAVTAATSTLAALAAQADDPTSVLTNISTDVSDAGSGACSSTDEEVAMYASHRNIHLPLSPIVTCTQGAAMWQGFDGGPFISEVTQTTVPGAELDDLDEGFELVSDASAGYLPCRTRKKAEGAWWSCMMGKK